MANAAASASELPPLRGLEEMIRTLLFFVEHLYFYILCIILIVIPKPDLIPENFCDNQAYTKNQYGNSDPNPSGQIPGHISSSAF